jgi:hypothetical protein
VIWCDKVGSTPLIGLALNWRYASGSELLEHFSPVVKDLVTDEDTAAFGVDSQDAFNLVFTTNDGFQYSINSNNITIGFAHRIKFKTVAGGRATIETITKSAPFSELLDEAIDRLIDAVRLLPDAAHRTFKRIGIVTNSIVEEEEEFPPGILKLISYYSDAWQTPVDYYLYSTTLNLGAAGKYSERCIHKISKIEGKDSLPNLNFDWQRTLSPPKALHQDTVRNEVRAAKVAALKYFESLAEGNEFNERVVFSENPRPRAE